MPPQTDQPSPKSFQTHPVVENRLSRSPYDIPRKTRRKEESHAIGSSRRTLVATAVQLIQVGCQAARFRLAAFCFIPANHRATDQKEKKKRQLHEHNSFFFFFFFFFLSF